MPQPADRELAASTEDDLLRRMREGDRDAAAAFLFRRQAELESWSRRRLRPEDGLSHGTDDLFSTVLRRWDRLVARHGMKATDVEGAQTMLFAIARRAIVNVFRQRATQRRHLPELAREEEAQPLLGDIAARESFERLRALIGQLEPAAFALLSGKLRGSPTPELARELDCTPEAIRHRWGKLRRELLNELGIADGTP
jgi:DNA-directed RNA polymerase specialized sigma24 family protein